jgi:hypothetical protein
VAQTRRRFLKLLTGAAGGAIAIGAVGFTVAKTAAGSFYRKLVDLPRTPTGPLTAAEVATLLAATEALIDLEVDSARYDDFFRWKAENVRGYRSLYASFVQTIDRQAGGFEKAGAEQKRRVLSKASRVREVINAGDKIGGLRIAAFDRDWLLYERFIIREILTLFSKTDAWILAGYGPHPGVPRGLDAYLRAADTK